MAATTALEPVRIGRGEHGLPLVIGVAGVEVVSVVADNG
jgi:hypothetical protein